MTLQTVYDSEELDLASPKRKQLTDWLHSEGIKVDETYRVEVHLDDRPCARVFQYALDGNGFRHCPHPHDHNDGTCIIARRDPFDVALSSLPPVEPWGLDGH